MVSGQKTVISVQVFADDLGQIGTVGATLGGVTVEMTRKGVLSHGSSYAIYTAELTAPHVSAPSRPWIDVRAVPRSGPGRSAVVRLGVNPPDETAQPQITLLRMESRADAGRPLPLVVEVLSRSRTGVDRIEAATGPGAVPVVLTRTAGDAHIGTYQASVLMPAASATTITPVTVTVYDGNGRTVADGRSITVKPLVAPTITSVGHPATVVPGETVTVTVRSHSRSAWGFANVTASFAGAPAIWFETSQTSPVSAEERSYLHTARVTIPEQIPLGAKAITFTVADSNGQKTTATGRLTVARIVLTPLKLPAAVVVSASAVTIPLQLTVRGDVDSVYLWCERSATPRSTALASFTRASSATWKATLSVARSVPPGVVGCVLEIYGDGWHQTVRVPGGLTVKRATRITGFNAAPEPVRKGQALTLKGTLQEPATGTGPAGHRVVISFRRTGAAYRPVATAVTTAKGAFIRRLTATTDGYWQVRYAGSATHTASPTYSDYVDVRASR
ncbi:htaa domain protein [Planomonospora sphaerica]|uniref:Htaa domain protein n=1 Tax=Planomonospora sphaerica TaxID=161355 RepID=A0A171CX72_9ACTN|nr:htaa domain protein [Planomonospora sphaerica]